MVACERDGCCWLALGWGVVEERVVEDVVDVVDGRGRGRGGEWVVESGVLASRVELIPGRRDARVVGNAGWGMCVLDRRVWILDRSIKCTFTYPKSPLPSHDERRAGKIRFGEAPPACHTNLRCQRPPVTVATVRSRQLHFTPRLSLPAGCPMTERGP